MSAEPSLTRCPHCGMPLAPHSPPVEPLPAAPDDPIFEFVPVAGLPTSTHSDDREAAIAALAPAIAPSSPRRGPASAPAPGPGAAQSPLRWLLPSYASALTLALVWMLATGRIALRAPARPAAAPPPVSPVAEEAPLTTIPSTHRVRLGGTLRLGDLEIRPAEIRLGPVPLRSSTDPEGYRHGGDDALWLRLRLRNVSEGESLRPLDPASARRPDHGRPDSLIETDRAPLTVFPLAASSEWSIEGQEFPRLDPGDEADVWIVSEPNVRPRLAARMLWRIRLHTAADRADLIGVELTRDDLLGD
jgi:hypothetical protein